ncbi:MAG TPA: ABC transporter permease, partial [Solibacterales bacterium]|nr:ABC transporter permease [Bryobacterales bacterium]
HRRFRDALVAAEVAISVVLLAGTALLLRSFWQISQVEPGFESAAVLTANLSLSGTQYPTPERRIAFYEQLLARLRSEPGITNAAAASIIPLNGSNDQLFQIEGRPVREGTQMPDEQNRTVTADYFKTMGIALLRGRVFDGRDQRGAPEVVVISDSLAQKYWPGADPVGARIAFGDPQNGAPWVTIVGVVADVRDEQLHLPARPILYVPHSQYAFGAMSLIVRSAGAAPPSEDVLRRHVAALDPEVALYSVRSLQQIVTNSVASQRLNLLLISIFALQALALAAVGVYGVMNYVVQQQTRETGIRMAFGASPGEVLRLYLSRGFKLFGIGLAAGLAGALAVAQFLKTMLYGVAPSDPASYAAISIVLAGVTALACWLPARRAARVDPMVALRHQ